MILQVAGANHTTASLELRERLAACAADLPADLKRLRRECALEEVVVLSTCNRLEFYFVGDASNVVALMAQSGGFPPREAHNVIYHHEGEAAAEHLFAVAAGLDSMIVGETEVLAQCKSAYEEALEAGVTGAILNAAFQQAFVAAKRVHSETAVSRGHASVGSVGAALAREFFGGLEGRSVLVIGAGTMACNTLENLARLEPTEIVVANRSVKKGRMLGARFSGRAARLSSVPQLLKTADVLVTSASSQRHLVTAEVLRRAVANRSKPLLILDIAVPRNVEPASGELAHVRLYNIDSLQEMAEKNVRGRKKACSHARKIVGRKRRASRNFWPSARPRH